MTGSTPYVRLAPGVALFATPSGLLARSEGRWRRLALAARREERHLVERLAGGAMRILRDDELTVAALVGAGILVSSEASEPQAPPRFPDHVLVGAPDDARLGALLEERVGSGRRSLVLWIDERGIVAARDDGESASCPLCAWLFDSALARYITPDAGLAEVPRAFADHDRFLLRAVRLVDEARELRQGRVWRIDTPEGAAQAQALPVHPSCRCTSRPRSSTPPARVAALEWSAAAGARHAVVWPMYGEPSVARVVFRRSRVPWSTRPEAYGVALGSGPDAQLCALAEAIERFAMLHAPPSTEVLSGALDAPPLEASLVRELLFRDEQYSTRGFRFDRYDPGAEQDWCAATSLVSGRRCAVPASLVGRPRSGARALVDATSNGCAAHTDRDRAIDAALLELVERDAILIDSYAPLAGVTRLLDCDGPAGACSFVVTQDIDLPVVLAVAVRSDGALRCGSAAATTLHGAVARAHAELAVALSGSPRMRPPRALDDLRERYGPDDHLAFLRGDRARAALESLLARSRDVRLTDASDRWVPQDDLRATVIEAITRAGLEPWLVDRTLPEVFGEGWHVVRALVPGLVELSWGMPYRRLASRRIDARLAAGASLSTSPHPLA